MIRHSITRISDGCLRPGRSVTRGRAAFVNGQWHRQAAASCLTRCRARRLLRGTAIAATSSSDLFHALEPPHRARRRGLCTTARSAAVRKVEGHHTSTSWQPSLQAGQPDMLLGRPVRVSALHAGDRRCATRLPSSATSATTGSPTEKHRDSTLSSFTQPTGRSDSACLPPDGRLALAELQVLQQAAASGPFT